MLMKIIKARKSLAGVLLLVHLSTLAAAPAAQQARRSDSSNADTSPQPAAAAALLSGRAESKTLPGGAGAGESERILHSRPPQEVADGAALRSDTNLVAVPVSATDRSGRPILDLRREDFRLYEDGVEQPIAYFTRDEQPITVVLLWDLSSSMMIHNIRTTSGDLPGFIISNLRPAGRMSIPGDLINFVSNLRPADDAVLVGFADDVHVLAQGKRDEVLRAITAPHTYSARGSVAEVSVFGDALRRLPSTPKWYLNDNSRLYDAVDFVINRRLHKASGRKAVVIVCTDGVEIGSRRATYESTLRSARQADAPIYTFHYRPVAPIVNHGGVYDSISRRRYWQYGALPNIGRSPEPRDEAYLRSLAEVTGGNYWQADDPHVSLAAELSYIADELRRSYSLGYYAKARPPAKAMVEERRQVEVHVDRPDTLVRARKSYVLEPGSNKQRN